MTTCGSTATRPKAARQPRVSSEDIMIRILTRLTWIFLLAAVFLLSACATQRLNSEINYERGLRHELSVAGTLVHDPNKVDDIKISGHYYGLTRVENDDYLMIGIDETRADCGAHHKVMLYLPSVSGRAGKIREVGDANIQPLGAVSIIFPRGHDFYLDTAKKYKDVLSSSDYPNAIVLEYFPVLTAYYRANANNGEITSAQVIDDLEWECRSKTKYYFLHALYPFTAIYDVVTFPIQWLLWMIFM